MRIVPILGIPAATATLAACAPPPSTTVIVDPTPTCDPAAYQQFIGQKSPAISLPAGAIYRHYRTGDPVTMDMNPNRLNFEYNRSGTLTKVTCG